eukprot:TRINITY_DN3325_c0_g1_i1.p1 TRINITY_DN3325_c0_g1~~TRINITY_DN3325_c0_g1_i1.p1  ORF type:complete len:143 (-),score=0.07 TRINITY_DN3325_c0_g1_i1:61-489(-)
MDLQQILQYALTAMTVLVIAKNFLHLLGHRYCFPAILSLAASWFLLVVLTVVSEKFPALIYSIPRSWLGGANIAQVERELASFSPGYNWGKQINLNTMILMSILLILAFGIAQIVGELEKLNDNLTARAQVPVPQQQKTKRQ